MKFIHGLKKYWIPVAVFILVTAGLLTLIPRSNDDATASTGMPTVVVTEELPVGTKSDVVRSKAKIRMIPVYARVVGALDSLDDIPDGLLVSEQAIGQQLLATSFNESQVRALGDDFVAVSIRLDPQRWVGPLSVSGQQVNIYDVQGVDAELIASNAVIINPPSTDGLKPDDKSVVTFGVKRESVAAVLLAAKNEQVWVTSK